MRLRHLFSILSILLAVSAALITARSIGDAWSHLSQSHAGMQAIVQLRTMLTAYEMASRERGPANGTLGDAHPPDPSKRDLLTKARHRTDEAFEALLLSLEGDKSTVYETASRARQHLLQAREAVDQEASKKPEQRNAAQIRGVVSQMIGVIDLLSPALLGLTNRASASFPTTTDALLATVQAAALREYAGQLGSQLTATLATRQPLKTDEFMAINRLRGRIEQLREQLLDRAATLKQHQSVLAAVDIMMERYFNSALPFVESQIVTGFTDGNYQIDTAEFAARYVPDMDSIVSLRDVLLNDAIATSQAQLKEINAIAIQSAAGSALLFFLLILTWWLLHQRVVRPLTKTTELIVKIAEGNLDLQLPTPKRGDEIADMLKAVAVLRDNSIARQAAEQTIRQMAFYDPLTELPNRRLLEDRLQQALVSAQRRNSVGAVLFVDLDKFKQVNDEQGHEAGDWLLQQVARRMRAVVRESDTAARIGGDEFVVLLPDIQSLDNTLRIAEKIRHEMAKPFVMVDRVVLDISSSIGAVLFPEQAKSMDEVLRRGDEAMYAAKKQGRNQVVAFADDPQEAEPPR